MLLLIFPGAEDPVSSVNIAPNCCLVSSQIIPTLVSSPLSIIKPASTEALPCAPEDNTMIGSWTTIFDVLIVVVVPFTVKSPSTVKLPVAFIVVASNVPVLMVPDVVRLLSESDTPEALLVVIAFPVISISPSNDFPPTLNVVVDSKDVPLTSPDDP